MIEVLDRAKCCGCGACEQICPRKCISLKSNKEGFWYPAVDPEKCINCNRCSLVCPYEKIGISDKCKSEYKTFIEYTSESDIRKNSSSGEIFTLIAEKVIRYYQRFLWACHGFFIICLQFYLIKSICVHI